MATIPVPQTTLDYESQKLHEVLLPRDIPSGDENPPADPPNTPTAESPRTRRFRHELDSVNMSAVLFYLAGLVPIVIVAAIFF